MRIISGVHGGRRISPPAKMPYTRPTTDIAKEGIFNILENNLTISSLKTLDLFGGTGCISYELASRGATDLTIVEKDVSMHQFIKKTVEELRFKNFNVIKMDVFKLKYVQIVAVLLSVFVYLFLGYFFERSQFSKLLLLYILAFISIS